MNKKTVLLVTPSYPPYTSGAATYFSQLVWHLVSKKRINVIVLTTYHLKEKIINKRDDYTLFRIIPPIIKSIFLIRVTILPIITFLALFFLIIRYKIKVIHTHSGTAITLGVCLFSFITRVPVIMDVQDLMTPRWLLKFGKIKQYIATGLIVEDRLTSCGISRNKIFTILSMPSNYHSKILSNSRNNVSMVKLIYVGELNIKIKGIDILLKAFKELSDNFSNINLIIIGNGHDENFCKKFITRYNLNDRIRMKGALSNEEVLKEIANSDILILPSKTEAIPRVILEAFVFSKPVIASRVGGIPEIVINNKNGILIDPGNVKELINAVKLLINNKKLRDKLGAYGKEFIKKIIRWENLADYLLKIY